MRWLERPTTAAVIYAALAVIMTWPLAAGLPRDLPSDLGDPLLNSWILGWTATHVTALLRGDFGAAAGFWNANIFYPEPLTLAYSEHLTPQALQIAAVYAATGNLILCYNLLFLSTYVLSGLGMFLFVREITGAWRPAFVAGLIYAFIPYRVAQLSHLQVLSSQWMPFALFGLRRFFDTGRPGPLAAASVAVVAQNLSCTYYLAYFAPFLCAYGLHEIVRRGRLRDMATWKALSVAVVAIAASTMPFLLPYMELRTEGFVRTASSAATFSADLTSYITAPEELRLWGSVLRSFPLPEANLFPGVVPLALALVALLLLAEKGRVATYPDFQTLRYGRGAHLPVLFCAAALAVAVWLSFGPTVKLFGEPLTGAGLYAGLYQLIPGFDGLRVPARMGMIAMLFLSALAGMGIYAIESRAGRGVVVAALASGLFLIETFPAPIPMNRVGPGGTSVAPPPAQAYAEDEVPQVYRIAASLPADAVLLELPFGYPAHEAQYVYYSSVHWRKLVNGYSGWRPETYRTNERRLRSVLRRPERSWRALMASGATHVIVHEAAFREGRGRDVSAWLARQGAREVGAWDRDRLFELPPR